MKHTIIIILFLFVFKPLFPVVEYVVNYDYIATKLCENKDKPALKCNGKCHLMKELAKASNSEKPINDSSKKISLDTENLFFNNSKTVTFNVFNTITLKTIDIYNSIYFHKHITTIFHPPTLS